MGAVQLVMAVEAENPDWVCAGIPDEAIEAGRCCTIECYDCDTAYSSDERECPKCALRTCMQRAPSACRDDPDQAWLDARDAEFDDRWNARMNP